MQEGEIGFFWLLIEKIEEFQFGNPKIANQQNRDNRKRKKDLSISAERLLTRLDKKYKKK